MDCIFRSDESSFDVVTAGEARAVAQGYPVPYMDPGGYLVALPTGFLIGPDPSPHEWLDRRPYGMAIESCMDVGCGVFGWPNGAHFMGAEFFIEDDIHYGWMRVRNCKPVNAGYILDYVYETEPGVPILAGAFPEPGTVLLFASGAVAICRRRHARRG